MSDDKRKSLIDFTDDELLEAYRSSIKDKEWSPANYRKEMFWRSQERNTMAYNRWTAIIALATLINTIAIIVQLFELALSVNSKINGRPVDVLRFGENGFLLTDDYAGVVYYVYGT